MQAKSPDAEPDSPGAEKPEERGMLVDLLGGGKRRQGLVETMVEKAVRTVGSRIGRKIIRGLLGGILGDHDADSSNSKRFLRFFLMVFSLDNPDTNTREVL